MSSELYNEITGIGANVYDTLIKLPAFPEEDTKSYVDAVRQSGGGPAPTGLVAATKLGAAVSVMAVLSNDSVGKFLLADFERYHVDTSLIEFREGESFSATVLLNQATGSRTCLLNRGTLPKLELGKRERFEIENAKVLMVDGNELTAAITAAKIARAAGVKVLYDAGGRYEGIEELLKNTDILIPSAEFARGHSGKESLKEAAADLFEKYHPSVIVITNGKEGGLLYDGQTLETYPAFSVKVVDSNGAGDVFHGAFAFAVTRGFTWKQCCVFSSAVSALKCTKFGARSGVPTYSETIQFLKENGYNEL